jgi:hypothetical protein
MRTLGLPGCIANGLFIKIMEYVRIDRSGGEEGTLV